MTRERISNPAKQALVNTYDAWVKLRTQLLRNLADIDGVPVKDRFLEGYLDDQRADTIFITGTPAAGKTTFALEIGAFCQEHNIKIRFVSFDEVRFAMIEFFGAATQHWRQEQWYFLGFVLAISIFIPLEQFDFHDKDVLHPLFEEFHPWFSREITSERERKEFGHDIYWILEKLLRVVGKEISEPLDTLTVVEAPSGWQKDRGFLAVMIMAARDGVRKSHDEQTLSYFITLIPEKIDVAVNIRLAAALSLPENIKSNLLLHGVDVGPTYQNDRKSGEELYELFEKMASRDNIININHELIETAQKWLESIKKRLSLSKPNDPHRPDTLSRLEYILKRIQSVVLPAKMTKLPQADALKVTAVYLEERLLRLGIDRNRAIIAFNQNISTRDEIIRYDVARLFPNKKRPSIAVFCKDGVFRSQAMRFFLSQYLGDEEEVISMGFSTTWKTIAQFEGKAGPNLRRLLREKWNANIEHYTMSKAAPEFIEGVEQFIVLCERDRIPIWLLENSDKIILAPIEDPKKQNLIDMQRAIREVESLAKKIITGEIGPNFHHLPDKKE